VLVASVAAAVLLVGGGGAYLATSAVGGSNDDDRTGASAPGGDGTTPPPLALDGYTEGGTADTAGTGGTNGIAPGEPDPNGVTYRADGTLPAGPASAPVYTTAKNGEETITATDVTRLAKALGVEGKPVSEADGWLVGTAKDGTGPILRVTKQAPGTWSFSRYLAGGSDNCKSTTVCPQGSGAAAGKTVDPVSEAVAKKAAAPVLKAVGQDDAKLDASGLMGTQRVVNADPVVGGLPTYGWTTGIQVSAQGEVVGGSGQLATPVKSDTYPVLGAKATLALLNEPGAGATPEHRMGIGGCASPVPLKDRLEAPCGTTTRQKESLTVDKAVFGLASHAVAGRPALVPSWLFEVRAQGAAEGFTVTYPAVDPRYLAGAGSGTSAEPSPTATPTAPGDGPTSGTTTRGMKIEGYTVSGDGKELTVGFWGGVCSKYSASAKEDGEVKVTVTSTTEKGKVCIMLARATYETVRLDEPLGDRKVVGAEGQAIPEADFAKK
jgi:hypothetical protein